MNRFETPLVNRLPDQSVLLLLSGGKDSRIVLKRLLDGGYRVHCLCIDGIQGKEKMGATQAASEFAVPLEVVTLTFFDEETWNPIKLVFRDLAMGWIAIRTARKFGARAIATGVKQSDIENPKLWWLKSFLGFGDLVLRIFRLELMSPLIFEPQPD